jgi:F420-dependent oxidoreductase-like protein
MSYGDDMDVDLHVPRFTWRGDNSSIGPTLKELATTAEAVGVRTLSVMDHWFQMEGVWSPEEPMLEGYTTLGFVASATERLRVRLLVGGVTYRHPGLMAKTVTTLDVLSGGRAELGLGAAWYQREHLGLGVPFPPVAERFERLEESLQICMQMWSDNNGPYMGRHYQLAETLCSPAPVSSPRPGIMIGGGGEKKTLRLVAIYGDACNIFGNSETVGRKLDVLRQHCEEVGRDPNQIEFNAGLDFSLASDVEGIRSEVKALAAKGVQAVVVSSSQAEPVAWLESTLGPLIPEINAVESGVLG